MYIEYKDNEQVTMCLNRYEELRKKEKYLNDLSLCFDVGVCEGGSKLTIDKPELFRLLNERRGWGGIALHKDSECVFAESNETGIS